MANDLDSITHQTVGNSLVLGSWPGSDVNPTSRGRAIKVGGVIVYRKGSTDRDVVINHLAGHHRLTVGRLSHG